jgi:hypothetical protein
LKRTILFCFLCVFGFLSINAQIKPYITGGIDFATINTSSEYNNDFGILATPGYHFGIEFKHKLKENFNLNAGLLFSKKGFKQSWSQPLFISLESVDSVTTLNVSSYYLELPIIMEFRAKFEKMNILFGIGPYFAYGIGGKVNLDINSPSTNYNYSEKIRWSKYVILPGNSNFGENLVYDYGYSQIKRFDYGADIRLGVEFKSITLNAEYKYGLANLMWEYRKHEKLNNQSIGLSVAYTFGK